MNKSGNLVWRIAAGVAGSAVAAYGVKRLIASVTPKIIEAEHVVTITRPGRELFALWTDWAQVPVWMHGVRSVEENGAGITHWVVDGPNGKAFSYDAEVLEQAEGKRLAWKTTDDSELQAYGEVHFDETKRGTEVRVVLAYTSPVGLLGVAAAGLAGVEPTTQLKEHLRRFKQLAEAGEVATNEGPSARKKPHAEPGTTIKRVLDVTAATKRGKKPQKRTEEGSLS